jgi:tripartite-type tricarboxylate transporter receptor subunit TctC
LQARLADLGVDPMPMTPAAFETFIAAETHKWAKVINTSGMKPE